MCDKIDALNNLITNSNDTQTQISTDLQTVSQTQILANNNLQAVIGGEQLILGFMGWFLFFVVIKFFLNIFNKMF
ncbi:MAG: hypothetical protein WCJ54_02650 [Actinomycetota bacterium]